MSDCDDGGPGDGGPGDGGPGDGGYVPRFFLTMQGELHGEDTPENREVVRRIHACVNACEGISTEELESGIVQDMRRVIAGVIPVLKTRTKAG